MRNTFCLGRWLSDSLIREVPYVTLRSTCCSGLPLGLPGREVPYVTLEVHVLFRALAFGLPVREVLYVTLRSTFRSRR